MRSAIISRLMSEDHGLNEHGAVHGGAAQHAPRRNIFGTLTERLVATAILACAIGSVSAQAPSPADADSMHSKLQRVSEIGARPRSERPESVRTPFTEREVNAYLKYYGPSFLPRGLMDPTVDIGADGRVAVRGLVDLDAVRLSRQRDWLDPLNYLSGLLDFVGIGSVVAENRRGIVVFESATLAGVAVPKSVVKELVRYFTSMPERPNGVDIDAPIALPADIDSIELEPGRATVVQ